MNEIWVVFDGAEPDSAVIGCAKDVSGVLNALKTIGKLSQIHIKVYGDYEEILEISAKIDPYYSGDSEYQGKIIALRKDVYE